MNELDLEDQGHQLYYTSTTTTITTTTILHLILGRLYVINRLVIYLSVYLLSTILAKLRATSCKSQQEKNNSTRNITQ